GSPATQAGMRSGDIITAIDGTKVEDSGDLLGALRGGYKPGDQAQLTIIRDGNQQKLDVTLAENSQ
ncbi:MAG TPA: PDZ domain-containing protein, partial [Rubrobacteraceae bacterium]|nr:PDZ domain-containing protein [Rubrobacteraceae bacterium]